MLRCRITETREQSLELRVERWMGRSRSGKRMGNWAGEDGEGVFGVGVKGVRSIQDESRVRRRERRAGGRSIQGRFEEVRE